MTATRPGLLVALAAGFAALSYALAELAYGALPALSLVSAFTVAVLAATELAMAKVVRDRVQSRGTGRQLHRRQLHRRQLHRRQLHRRQLHPVQVFRAVVLARASSTGGAVLLGAYGGLLAWTLPRRDDLLSGAQEAGVAGLSTLASLGLVVAALLLERACRTPPVPGLGSPS